MLSASGRPVWFVGDLDDPWVESIADALAADVTRVSGEGDWYEALAETLSAPATLVIHRAVLTTQDAERLARLRRERPSSLRVILCVGPHARYADLQRWSGLVDVVLSESTARETIARHVRDSRDPRGPGPETTRPGVAIVSRNLELRLALADICEAAGYSVRTFADWSGIVPGSLVVWDVPILDPDGLPTLARHSQIGMVVALLGFADRSLVSQSRAQGASACLELPCDPADLIEVLDRLSASRLDPMHDVPPPPLSLRRGSRPVVETGRDSYN